MKTKQSQHLPGPWSIQPIGDESECNILGPNRELIATVDDNEARLIVAAPDLLAIVQKLFEYVDAGENTISFSSLSDHSDNVTLGDMVRVAIAKAEGK